MRDREHYLTGRAACHPSLRDVGNRAAITTKPTRVQRCPKFGHLGCKVKGDRARAVWRYIQYPIAPSSNGVEVELAQLGGLQAWVTCIPEPVIAWVHNSLVHLNQSNRRIMSRRAQAPGCMGGAMRVHGRACMTMVKRAPRAPRTRPRCCWVIPAYIRPDLLGYSAPVMSCWHSSKTGTLLRRSRRRRHSGSHRHQGA